MRRICLTLPTNRACGPAIAALHQEAGYAVDRFGAEVHLLVLDSSDAPTRSGHAATLRALPDVPGVVTHHLDEQRQRAFLERVIARSGAPRPQLLLDLLLPKAVSYGACTDRAFLIGAALGCDSVHRRDSDSRYQLLDGQPVFPVHHELAALGLPAAEAARAVSETVLEASLLDRPVTLVGGSFVGEPSVDTGEMRRLDPEVHREVVALWAPGQWSAERKAALVAESFTGAGTAAFQGDHARLTVVDPMRVDMCNIAFHRIQEQVPLPPATDTIGSDYFLFHLVQAARLPGVVHNRHIENFHTPERRTGPGFRAYQLRLVKFFLSMLYLNDIYARLAEAGDTLLGAGHRVRTDALAELVRRSTGADRTENLDRLDTLQRCYHRLGGRYAEFADALAPRRARLLDRAQRDIEDFALLVDAWGPLVEAGRDQWR